MSGSTMKPWMARPSRTTMKYQASFLNSAARSLFSSSWPAIRKQTPRGARWMIHVVIFIITTLRLSKNCSRGLPASPQTTMATPLQRNIKMHLFPNLLPITKLNTMRPRMLELLLHVFLKSHVSLSSGSIVKPVLESVT